MGASSSRDIDERNADQCVRDAAHEMLKALKQIHFYETVRDPNRGELYLGALRAVEAAIAKAEGRR